MRQRHQRLGDLRGLGRGLAALVDDLGRDVRLGVRTLGGRPGFAALIVLMLGIGIGASTAMFTVVRGVLIDPLPYPAPDRLVLFQAVRRGQVDGLHFSAPACTDYRTLARSFEAVACLDRLTDIVFNLEAGEEPRHVVGVPVSSDYFAVLGIRPMLGRSFGRDEERRDARVVIIGHSVWRDVLGGRLDAVGRSVTLDHVPCTVVGILPERYPTMVEGGADVWIPQDLAPGERNQRNNAYVTILGRLRPGVTIQQAQAELSGIDHGLAQQHGSEGQAAVRLLPLADSLVGGSRPLLVVLTTAAGLVLLVASFNVANLILLRVKARESEFGVRVALGAGRSRLVRQFVAEHGVLAALGGAMGVCLAWGMTRALVALGGDGIPRLDTVSVGPSSVLFALLAMAAVGLFFGVVPLIQMPGRALAHAIGLAGRPSGAAPMRQHARSLFVVGQVSTATVLLVGAVLLSATLVNLLRVDPGFRAQNVVSFQVHVPEAAYPSPESLVTLRRALTERLEAIPGVRAAGFVSRLPLTGAYNTWGFQIEGRSPTSPDQPSPVANFRGVGGHYFRALGIGLVAGRLFDDRDSQQAPPVVVVGETLARRDFPAGRVLGESLRVAGRTWTIVGVVRDTRTELREPAPPTAYIPFDQYPRRRWSLAHVVAADGARADLVASIRGAVGAVDRSLVPYAIERLDDLVARRSAQSRLAWALMTAFGAVAVVLAVVGIYGVVSFSVATRRHEIGIRLALGAGRARIVSLFLASGARLAAIGVVCGIAMALGATRLMSGILFGVTASSPTAIGAAAAVLVWSTLLACYLPARRGSRLDPQAALRHD